MKFIKHEDIAEGCVPSTGALFVFGKRAESWYVIFNSPIKYKKWYTDIARFEKNRGVGFNRYMISYINKKWYFTKVFYPMHILEKITAEWFFQRSQENADSGDSVVGI